MTPPKDTTTIEEEASRGAKGEERAVRRTGYRLTPYERIKIAQRYLVEQAKPKGVKKKTRAEFAKEFGISLNTLDRLVADFRQDNEDMTDALGIVGESLHLYTEAIQNLAYEAEHGETGAVRVGATRSMLEAVKGRLELLVAVNMIPRRLGAAHEQQDLVRMVHEIARVLESNDIPEEVVLQILRVVEEDEPQVIEGHVAAG